MTSLTSQPPTVPREAPAARGGPSARSSLVGRRLDPRSGAAARRWLLHAAALIVFALAVAGSLLAHQGERPITTAIIFLLGVTIVGALEGLWGGLVAALLASALYNFFLAEPAFRFSLLTLEDYVPLIAFNAAAIASGYLTGRLNDRARAAETATRRVEALLALSRRLQAAVGVDDVVAALDAYGAGRGSPALELFVADESGLRPARAETRLSDLAKRAFAGRSAETQSGNEAAFLLAGTEARLGVLLACPAPRRQQAEDLAALANLISITVERCRLLDRLAEAELVRRSEELKTALLSSVSHDMRTPLSAISASASSLARYGAELPEAARADMLAMIQEQCQRLDRYTTNLLSLGRLQAGLDRERFTPCDAIEALGAALVQVRALSGGHPVEKRIEVGEGVVLADPVMLEQIFHNVLENAVIHGGADQPVTVSAAKQEGILQVRIRDHGPGIPAGESERVFDRFYRGGHGTGPDGSGLGLAIARGFTEAFGGRIRAGDPEDGGLGTLITIELPLVEGSSGDAG
ncbi:sensor histidine kinase [Sphingosinicella terrae]|uniref:sensor histidine kinase n=1 Tax=Sphingosinicella terrae TaxID=2172047 RepID=UPI0013B45F69|nr:ATP-binding protein [Sphingosinicella terrae]